MDTIEKCPYCNETHPIGARFCPKTGKPLPEKPPHPPAAEELTSPPENFICPNCGASMPPAAKFCSKCRTKLDVTAENPPEETNQEKERRTRASHRFWVVLPLVTIFLCLIAAAAGSWLFFPDQVAAFTHWNLPQPPALFATDTPNPTRTSRPTLTSAITPTFTVVPTQTSRPTQTRYSTATLAPSPTEPEHLSCSGAPPLRVEIGDFVQVVDNVKNLTPNHTLLMMRSEPKVSQNLVLYVPGGTQLKILEGPVCADDVAYFFIEEQTKFTRGWINEAVADTKDYLIEPIPDLASNTHNTGTSQEELTLKITDMDDDAEVGVIQCAVYSDCKNAQFSNFLLTGYSTGTIEATFDGSTYGVKRAFLYFDLSEIPAGATIREVNLNIFSGTSQAGNSTVHVVRTNAGHPPTSGDYSKVVLSSGGSVDFINSSWTSFPITTTALSWFQPGQIISLALVNELDLHNTIPGGRNTTTIMFSENATYQPYLIVKYYPPGSSPNPDANTQSMEGKWLDPDTSGTYHVIVWKNNGYEVTQSTNPERGGNELTSSTWNGTTLTWVYCVSGESPCITTETISVNGDELYTKWSSSNGGSGYTTMTRVNN
jgi:hypothetical protein